MTSATASAPVAASSGWTRATSTDEQPARERDEGSGTWTTQMTPARTPTAAPPARRLATRFTGAATFYGADFQGQPMAAGPLFNMLDPTVTASNYWPLGTR